MASQSTLGLPNGLCQHCTEAFLEPVLIISDPPLYKAIKESTKSTVVADGDDDEPTSAEPSTKSDHPINILSCIKFEGASGTPCKSKEIGIVQVIKGTDSTDHDPTQMAFYCGDMRMSMVSTPTDEEELDLVDAASPYPPKQDLFGLHIEGWEPGVGKISKFKPAIGGYLAAVIYKDGTAKIKCFTSEELQEQVKRNHRYKKTDPMWQFTIADVTVNTHASATNTCPIAMFYHDKTLCRGECYFITPDPNKKCVKLKKAQCNNDSINHHRMWTNSYPT